MFSLGVALLLFIIVGFDVANEVCDTGHLCWISSDGYKDGEFDLEGLMIVSMLDG